MANSATSPHDRSKRTNGTHPVINVEERIEKAFQPVHKVLSEWADDMIDMVVRARAYQLAYIASEHDFSGIDETLSRAEREEGGYAIYIRDNKDENWTRYDHLTYKEMEASAGPILDQHLNQLHQQFSFIDDCSIDFVMPNSDDSQRLSLQAELGQRHLATIMERTELTTED